MLFLMSDVGPTRVALSSCVMRSGCMLQPLAGEPKINYNQMNDKNIGVQ